MVVVFDDKEKDARLSLRQTEILEKLDTIVNNINADCPSQYVFLGHIERTILMNMKYFCA